MVQGAHERLRAAPRHGRCLTCTDGGVQLVAAIRDDRLYRTTHGTFEDYCAGRWSLSRPRDYELIGAAQVVGLVSAVADTRPANEAQARPLTRLREDPVAVRSAWARATDHAEAEQKPVTAAIVELAVQLGVVGGFGRRVPNLGGVGGGWDAQRLDVGRDSCGPRLLGRGPGAAVEGLDAGRLAV